MYDALDSFWYLPIMTNMNEDSSSFLDNISSYSDDVFYRFAKEFVGVVEGEILEIQRIKNVRLLLRIPDVFSFFQINSKDTLDLKERACFINDDMEYVVRAGVRSNIEQFIELLQKHHQPRAGNIIFVYLKTTTSIIILRNSSMCVPCEQNYDTKTCRIGTKIIRTSFC